MELHSKTTENHGKIDSKNLGAPGKTTENFLLVCLYRKETPPVPYLVPHNFDNRTGNHRDLTNKARTRGRGWTHFIRGLTLLRLPDPPQLIDN